MANSKHRTINAFYLYATLALSFTTASMTITWDSDFGYVAYATILAAVVLVILGKFKKHVRLVLRRADTLLLISGILLLLANVWVLVSSMLPQQSMYHLDYVNFWQGWPIVPFSLVLSAVLLRAKRSLAKRLALSVLGLVVVTLLANVMVYIRLYGTIGL